MTGIIVPFSIISDRSGEIARKYGMIATDISNTETVRNVFIIDDKGKIRTILIYPMNVGRWIPEILRIVQALQVADTNNAADIKDLKDAVPYIAELDKMFDADARDSYVEQVLEWLKQAILEFCEVDISDYSSSLDVEEAIEEANIVIDAIKNDRQPYVDAVAGRNALELVLAIYKSAAENKPVDLPLKECASTDFAGRFDNE